MVPKNGARLEMVTRITPHHIPAALARIIHEPLARQLSAVPASTETRVDTVSERHPMFWRT